MKLKFKQQPFQNDAVNAVCDVFAGQPRYTRQYLIDQGDRDMQVFTEMQTGFGNKEILLDDTELEANIQAVQRRSNMLPIRKLEKITIGNRDIGYSEKLALTVEMETGTGKTYTYIKTIYEMFERYGWSKFIVVVPSIAIREGVLKSFQITQEHFAGYYGKKCRFFVYNSSRLTELEHFAGDCDINVMIINTQAFNATGKDARRIDMTLDSFRSRKPIDVVAAVNPVVIIDEPQSVIGTAQNPNTTRQTLKKFNPLFFINYSATHRENFNMVYRLDAVDAYQKQLVKKITVKGIHITGITTASGYLYLQKINVFKDKNPTANISFEHASTTRAEIIKKTKTCAYGDNLYYHSGEIEKYRNGYIISDINAKEGFVEFANGLKIYEGQYTGEANDDDLRLIQIRETILSHLEKERELFRKGIKVLSLFFIDEVAKYKGYKENGEEFAGQYAEIFEREYEAQAANVLAQLPFEEEKQYRAYLESFIGKTNQIHAGYFSIDNKGRAVNSKIKRGETESDDISAYDLIMRNKERLLSLEEPVRFVFSHSALREGWDNPNVFQICTLRTGQAEIRKRQEIGRGLRLCVDKNGDRQDGELLGYNNVHQINALTVIANESYEQFAKGLQDEMAEVIRNRPKEITPKLFENQTLYSNDNAQIKIDSSGAARIFIKLEDNQLIADNQLTDAYHQLEPQQRTEKIAEIVGEQFAPFAEQIVRLLDSVYDFSRSPMVENARKNTKLILNRQKFDGKEFKELWKRINAKTFYTVAFNDAELIEKCVRSLDKNLYVNIMKAIITTGTQHGDGELQRVKTRRVDILTSITKTAKYDLIGEIAERANLTRKVVGEILQKIHIQTFEKFNAYPDSFIFEAAKIIESVKAQTIIEHITYNKLEEVWNAEEIFVDNEIGGLYGQNVADARKHIYDKLRYDSDVEKKIGAEMDIADEVELYVKLPSGFYIHTPMGKYNPDWAVILKEGAVKHIYFVAESKGSTLDLQLKGIENAKITCARRHFEKISNGDIKYDVINSFDDLLTKIRS